MASKQEPSTVYPDMGTVPDALPYDTATAPPEMDRPQQVYVVQQPPPNAQPLGPKPSMVTCPSCHVPNMSQIRYETGIKTHLIAAILLMMSCCCLPYMIDSCQNANHHCSNCGAYLGTYDSI